MGDLMNPEEVAIEIVDDVEEYMPNILERIKYPQGADRGSVETAELEGRVMYQIQDAKISMYNMHMELQGVDFPLDNASDFSDEVKFQKLLDWLKKHHPKADEKQY